MTIDHVLKGFMFWFAGDITQKGYEKKRTRLLAPYVPKQAQGMSVFSLTAVHSEMQ
jgi:hypothetical protein